MAWTGFVGGAQASAAATWEIAVAGNAYRTTPVAGDEGFEGSRGIRWSDHAAIYSVFFRVDRAAALSLSLRARVPQGRSQLRVEVGDRHFERTLEGSALEVHAVGAVNIPKPGYVRVDLRGLERSGDVFAVIEKLVVSSATENLALDYVRTNEDEMFYWGRRGPSVHLVYNVPDEQPLQYAYSEVTVPPGQDPVGSYFMANGFAEGYFGLQVTAPGERRVLFSVWSPYETDDPREIPEKQRVVAVARGPGVTVGEFGDEGSGGQSYLEYPWKAGKTYRFLTEVQPDGKGNTIYHSWFGDRPGEWRLIAGFRRPATDTTLQEFHSFLENFEPSQGYLGRRVHYTKIWVRDVAGTWREVTTAELSVDPTGEQRHRRDFAGGSDGQSFFLRNGGFFDATVEAGSEFVRRSSGASPPEIDLDSLPR